MIEKYLKLGVRYHWTKSQNVDGPRDGGIVDSIRPTSPLTYIGLGEVLAPRTTDNPCQHDRTPNEHANPTQVA